MKLCAMNVYMLVLCLIICHNHPVNGLALHWKINKIKQIWPLNLYFKDDAHQNANEPYVVGQVVQMAPKYPVWKIHKYDGIQLKPVSTIPILQVQNVPNLTAKPNKNVKFPSLEELKNILGGSTERETFEMLNELASSEDGRTFMSNYIKTYHPDIEITDNDIFSALNHYKFDLMKKESVQRFTPSIVQQSNVAPGKIITSNVSPPIVNYHRQPNIPLSWNGQPVLMTPINPYKGNPQMISPVKRVEQNKPVVPFIINKPSFNNVNIQQQTQNVKKVGEGVSNSPIIVVPDQLPVTADHKVSAIVSDSQNKYNINSYGKITRQTVDKNGQPLISFMYDYPNFSYTQLSKVPTIALPAKSNDNIHYEKQDKSQSNTLQSAISVSSENAVAEKVNDQNNIFSSIPIYVVPPIEEDLSNKFVQSNKVSPQTVSGDINEYIEQNIDIKSENNLPYRYTDETFLPVNRNTDSGVKSTVLSHVDDVHVVAQDNAFVNGRPVNSLNYNHPSFSYSQLSEIPLTVNNSPTKGLTSYDVPLSVNYEDLVPAASEIEESVSNDGKAKNVDDQKLSEKLSEDASTVVYAIQPNSAKVDESS